MTKYIIETIYEQTTIYAIIHYYNNLIMIKFCFSGKFGSEESEIKHLSHPLLYDINIFKTRQASFLKMSIFTLGKPREISTLLLARQASRARSVDIV